MAYVTNFERIWEKRIKKSTAINMLDDSVPLTSITG